MPKRRTDDAVHVVMTDHFIQRRPPAGPLAMKTEPNYPLYRGRLSLYLPDTDQELDVGLALSRGADLSRGVQLIQSAIQRNPSRSAEAFFHLGAAYAGLEDYSRAVESYTKGLKLDPGHAEARFNMALALIEAGETAKAANELKEAIQRKPQLAAAYIALGTIDMKSGNLNSARENYLHAVSVDAMNTVALNNLGLLEYRLGDRNRARAYFQQVLRISPEDATAKEGVKQ
jgi:tetratricopeptide (TPR) repeat protein